MCRCLLDARDDVDVLVQFCLRDFELFVIFWSNFVKEISNLHIFSLSFGYNV